jgi:hypothetical protein
VSEELLNELTEKLIAAYRTYLEAQRAYYGRENEVDEERETAVVNTYEAFRRAEFLHGQALILYATHPDLESESDYIRVARSVAAKEGWPA